MTATTHQVAALVDAARRGDETAWRALIAGFDRRLRRIARSFRLSDADVDDAVQATWVRLHGGIGDLRTGGALDAWLATTVRRECLRIVSSRPREVLTDDPGEGDENAAGPEEECLAAERRTALHRAVATLTGRQRRLVVLLAGGTADYRAISAALGMPVGSIGPVRARGLERLRSHPDLVALAG